MVLQRPAILCRQRALMTRAVMLWQQKTAMMRHDSRLLVAAYQEAGIADRFVENESFHKTIDTLQRVCCGYIRYKLPDRNQISVIRPMKAARERERLKDWVASVEMGSLCINGRAMKEGRNKEAVLNCVNNNRQQFFRELLPPFEKARAR